MLVLVNCNVRMFIVIFLVVTQQATIPSEEERVGSLGSKRDVVQRNIMNGLKQIFFPCHDFKQFK